MAKNFLTQMKTMSETAADQAAEGEVQDKSLPCPDVHRAGLLVAQWSVESQNLKQGAAAGASLAAGTYTTVFTLPEGAIISGNVLVDVSVAKVGSGTITPKLGSTSFTAVSTRAVTNEVATSGLTPGTKMAAAAAVTVVVASDVVTAGAFTAYIPYIYGASPVA